MRGLNGRNELDAVQDVVRRLVLAYDSVDAAVVEAAVKEACEVFREARVRAFVPILVERRARGALTSYRRTGSGSHASAPRPYSPTPLRHLDPQYPTVSDTDEAHRARRELEAEGP
ncbi:MULTISPECIES: three-helix bundle dimerization domain-containing protein [Streptomyces]|uniref:Three-helix bundle dimerization domain-containing protein n=2 Tax=Streptomyces TaxID=1883 RepID=A0ABV9IZI6_9ACTN